MLCSSVDQVWPWPGDLVFATGTEPLHRLCLLTVLRGRAIYRARGDTSSALSSVTVEVSGGGRLSGAVLSLTLIMIDLKEQLLE